MSETKMVTKTISQSYEMSVLLDVEVPEDWTDEDLIDNFSDFPIEVTVNSEFDDEMGNPQFLLVEHLSALKLYIREDAGYGTV